MKENENTLVATLLMPNILETSINGNAIQIENQTQYPYQNDFIFKINQSKASKFTLKIRKPNWVKKINTNEVYTIEEDFILIEREFSANDAVHISFDTEVEIKTDATGSHYFTYGALLYALPIHSKEIRGKTYGNNFTDFNYEPLSDIQYTFKNDSKPRFKNGKIEVQFINQKTKTSEKVQLIPMGKTVLRQVTF